MTPLPRLSDILKGDRDALARDWDRTQAAEDFAPLPRGEYVARIVGGELSTARTGTPGYKIAFRVLEGPHGGRHFWHDVWRAKSFSHNGLWIMGVEPDKGAGNAI